MVSESREGQPPLVGEPPISSAAAVPSKPGTERSVATSTKQRSSAVVQPELPPVHDTQSHRSSVTQRSSAAGGRHSHSGSTTGGRSITSSVALSKLQQLEEMLLEERRAREQAEVMLLSMQKEKLQREVLIDKGAQTQKQLSDVMSALQRVVANPDDSAGLLALRNLARGVPPPNSTSAAPPPTPPLGGGQDVASSSSANREGRSFLDNIGHFDRQKQRATAAARTKARVSAAGHQQR